MKIIADRSRQVRAALLLTATPFQLEPREIHQIFGAIIDGSHGAHRVLSRPPVREFVAALAEFFRGGEEPGRALKRGAERTLCQALFVDAETKTQDLQFVPVQYRAVFICNDPACSTAHDLSILDWGTYVLHRRQYAQRGGPQAERDVIDKLTEDMDLRRRNAHFFLGNTMAHPASFMVVGLYFPPCPAPDAPPKQTMFPF